MSRSLLVTAFLLLSPLTAFAHSLGAECKVRGQRVEVEAFFSDNTPAQDANVSVFRADKSVVAEGKTDAEGRWTFDLLPTGNYEVVVDAGAGHRTAVALVVRESLGASATSTGPGRGDFTRTPWARIGLGLGMIAVPAIVVYFWLRKSRSRNDSQK